MRSPASPRPGTMKKRELRRSSTTPVNTGTSGCARSNLAMPSGAEMRFRNLMRA